MQQITILYDIVWLGRADVSRRLMIGLFLLSSIVLDCGYARGPHHPRSEVNRRVQQQQHINEHLGVDTKYVLDFVWIYLKMIPFRSKRALIPFLIFSQTY